MVVELAVLDGGVEDKKKGTRKKGKIGHSLATHLVWWIDPPGPDPCARCHKSIS